MTRLDSPRWKAFMDSPSTSSDADLRALMLDLRGRALYVNRTLREIERQSDPSTLDKVEELDRDLDVCELAMCSVVTELESRRRKAG